jgi:S1 RNA binding domain protein
MVADLGMSPPSNAYIKPENLQAKENFYPLHVYVCEKCFLMQLEVGNILEGKVTGITKFGAFVDLGEGKTGMVHISEVASTYVKEIKDQITENQMVKVKILSIGEDGKISLSIKKAVDNPPPQQRRPQYNNRRDGFDSGSSKKNEPPSFEDMMSKFKQSSDEKMSDLLRIQELEKSYGDKAVVKGISFNLKEGEILGYV